MVHFVVTSKCLHATGGGGSSAGSPRSSLLAAASSPGAHYFASGGGGSPHLAPSPHSPPAGFAASEPPALLGGVLAAAALATHAPASAPAAAAVPTGHSGGRSIVRTPSLEIVDDDEVGACALGAQRTHKKRVCLPCWAAACSMPNQPIFNAPCFDIVTCP